METKTPNPSPANVFPDLGKRGLEALAALAQVNQVVMGQFIELGSTAARETLRTCAEIGSASIEAMRSVPAPTLPSRQTLEELGQDPLAACRQALMRASEDAQRTARLLEAGAQIVTRSAERFQATADRAGKDIREAMTGYTEQIQEICARS